MSTTCTFWPKHILMFPSYLIFPNCLMFPMLLNLGSSGNMVWINITGHDTESKENNEVLLGGALCKVSRVRTIKWKDVYLGIIINYYNC